MTKPLLADVVRSATGCTVAQSKDAVDGIIELIGKALKREGTFGVIGFGTFNVSKRAARAGRNPLTGEKIKIKASKSVRFKASKTLKERL